MSGIEVGALIVGAFESVSVASIVSGAVASYVVNAAFAPRPPNSEGPRLNDLKIQSSTYGTPIPRLFGTYRMAGTVIWATALREVAVTAGGGGGKGAPNSGTSTQYTYYVNFAIALCEGEITGIRRIWADGRLIHDPAFASMTAITVNGTIRIYAGSETDRKSVV